MIPLLFPAIMFRRALLPAILLISPASAHDHFAAGWLDANHNGIRDIGEPLEFAGDDGTGRVFHLLPRPAGQPAGGFYQLDERPRSLHPDDAFSFTVLSNGDIEIADPRHPSTGSWIWMEITAVEGPPGAKFGFWDENHSLYQTTPTISFATGEPTGNFAFQLSEGTDDPSEDPQGHIHGRTWSADTPGDYHVTFRLVDRSTSAPGGGPLHSPSREYTYHFKAGPDFTPSGSWEDDGSFTLSWPSRMGINAASQTGISFTIQRSSDTEPGWRDIGSAIGTVADTIHFTDPSPPPRRALYRLRYDWNPGDPAAE